MDNKGPTALQPHLGEHESAHIGAVSEILQTKGHVEVELFLGPRQTCCAGQRTPHTPARRHEKRVLNDHKQKSRVEEMKAMAISSGLLSLCLGSSQETLFVRSQRGGHAYQLNYEQPRPILDKRKLLEQYTVNRTEAQIVMVSL